MPRTRHCLLAASALLLSPVVAQEGPPGPAPELQKFAPLIGNWAGSGDATFGPGAPPTKWDAHGTYRWCLDGHWVQEDFAITFAGMPAPMVLRSYLGWDRENQRYVYATAGNMGQVRLNEIALMPDGTMAQVTLQNQEGMPYAERSLFKVDGDKLLHSVDLLMPEGPSMTIVDGHFTRTDKSFDGRWDEKPFMGVTAAAPVQQLARCAGAYDLTGEFVMAPGAPAVRIKGTDTFRAVFGGTVLYGSTMGTAEGLPGEYHGEVFWGYDAPRKCLVAVYVSNMGEVMTMDAWFGKDGALLSTSHGTMQGEPMVQRMVMEMDADGRPLRTRSDSIVGSKPPFESFRATYTRK